MCRPSGNNSSSSRCHFISLQGHHIYQVNMDPDNGLQALAVNVSCQLIVHRSCHSRSHIIQRITVMQMIPRRLLIPKRVLSPAKANPIIYCLVGVLVVVLLLLLLLLLLVVRDRTGAVRSCLNQACTMTVVGAGSIHISDCVKKR